MSSNSIQPAPRQDLKGWYRSEILNYEGVTGLRGRIYPVSRHSYVVSKELCSASELSSFQAMHENVVLDKLWREDEKKVVSFYPLGSEKKHTLTVDSEEAELYFLFPETETEIEPHYTPYAIGLDNPKRVATLFSTPWWLGKLARIEKAPDHASSRSTHWGVMSSVSSYYERLEITFSSGETIAIPMKPPSRVLKPSAILSIRQTKQSL